MLRKRWAAVFWPSATIDKTRSALAAFAERKLARLGPCQEHTGLGLSLHSETVHMLSGLDWTQFTDVSDVSAINGHR